MRSALVRALRACGVDVSTALEAGMIERSDEEHLEYAMKEGRVLYSFNIAEGYRRGSQKEYIQFLKISLGSNAELETQLSLSMDIGLIEGDKFKEVCSENRFPMCHCDPERSEGEAISLSLSRDCFGALPLATTTYFHDSLVGSRPWGFTSRREMTRQNTKIIAIVQARMGSSRLSGDD